MKKLLTLLFLTLTFAFAANAKTYYVSNSGNDNNNGLSTSAPWKTLAKVSSFKSFVAGDAILFNRGEVFYGKLTINNSGSSGNPITFGAYGTGANPVISGFANVTAWTNLGSNIWESASAISTLSTANIVVINGVNTSMGRYPNSGYLTYQSFVGTTSITSSSLTGSPNWTGAEAVIRKQRYLIERDPITAQSGGTVTYKSSTTYNAQSGYGFFIQNDSRTLDQQNEWYYNSSTKKLRIYSTSSPANVLVSTVDTLVNISRRNFLTFNNISFQGSNQDAFTIMSSASVSIQNCSIDFSGKDAICGVKNGGGSSANFVFKNSSINHTNNNAIALESEFTNAYVGYNTIKNTGLDAGMGANASSNYGTLIGVQIQAVNATIEYNSIDSTGFNVIFYNDNNVLVRNNLITNFCTQKLDGAAIYSYVGAGVTPPTNQKIFNNIIINGIGNASGTNAPTNIIAHGIYLDDGNANAEIAYNSLANCAYSGIYIHNSNTLNVHDNTCYNNGLSQVLFASFNTISPIRKVNFKNNIMVSQTTSQNTGSFQSVANDLTSFGTMDSNYYARPISDGSTMNYSINNYATGGSITLAQWQPLALEDSHSKKSPKTITSLSSLIFNYNASSSSVTIPLNGTYIDVKNVSYNGSITLAPYTSAVLILNGTATNQAPTANAGSDQTITIPTSTVSLSGSGTDPDGTISAYSWTKISVATSGTITSSTSAATTVTGLAQGVYQFQLKVTDNAGATDLDTVQVTVNAAIGTLLPAVNPGNTVNGVNYWYYESITGWKYMPIFSGLIPVRTGAAANFDISSGNVSKPFSFYFYGYINVPADGQYTFYTTSDDGSYLAIDRLVVVNNDGVHTAKEKSGTIGLKAGKHAISVGYFQQSSSSVLTVSYAGPGVTKQSIPASALYIVSTTGSNILAMDNSANQNITSTNQFGIIAYPNPFINSVKLKINGDAGDYKLMLIDVMGRIIWTKAGTKSQGSFEQSINTSSLQKGIYFLRVIQNNSSSVIKVEK